MLSAEEAQAQVALDLEAQQDMKVGRWEATPDIMSRWKGEAAPAKIGAMIAKYYYRQSGYSAAVFSKASNYLLAYLLLTCLLTCLLAD